jgi:aspartyl-tRNA(Asn)/glutamyl-tRNA(Gln) amidotransferase subunit A
VSGLRPTFGRVSRYGAMALSWTMDKLGPMCRSADDCGLVLAAIAGPDPRDALTATAPFAYEGAHVATRASAPDRSSRRMTIGVLRDATLGVQPEIAANFEATLEVLRGFATLVPDVQLPDLPFNAAAETIVAAECASAFEELIESGRVRELTAPEDRWGGYAQTAVLAKDYLKALRLRGPMAAAVDAALAPYDCVVSPTTDTVSYPVDRPFAQAWPPVPMPDGARPVPLGGAANLVGLPGIAVPNGFGREGLPTSVLFTGRAFDEHRILAAAVELQRRTDWHRRRPTVR